ncbi:MAG: PSD1 and planctomycete cytochrome C domain-containing protein [Rubripirellula sp.]
MRIRFSLSIVALFSSVIFSSVILAADPPVDFGRDVRPILSDHCFACHGPDEEQRAADLRLDSSEGIGAVVDGSDLEASELVSRILSDDDDSRMPPPKFHKPLSPEQIKVLKQWVASGAEFQQHWAFVTPEKPAIPAEASNQSAIDYFIASRAQEAGLELNGPANRTTLLRRVCLDLTGLPPTRKQIEDFLADTAPDAYEKLVDQLLQSHQYGEHVGRYWLDLVRYADTHGLHLDNYREMWPYRDWVINAINKNMPFDQFIQHQLAGDLLPEAGDAEKIASGFNRLNVTTNEGGSIYDEVFARNVMDRTDAFGTIFLGLTTGCAVCHDHKFDPISQHEYYSLSAFFNSIDGRAMDGNVKDHAPVIRVPSQEQQQQQKEFGESLAQLRREMIEPIPTVDEAQRKWEKQLVDGTEPTSVVLMPAAVTSEAKVVMKTRPDGSVELTGKAAAKDTTTIVAPLPAGVHWQTLRLEALTDTPDQRVGVSGNGNVVLTEITVEMADSLSEGEWVKVPIAHAFADVEQQDGAFAVSYAIDSKEKPNEGWAAGGHQKTGGRTAWFVVPSLAAEGDDAKIRVQLKYKSQFAAHQFRRVRLSVSDAAPMVPADQRITLGEIHTAGPFEVESANPGYSRKFASQQGPFNVEEEFKHGDRVYRWHHRGDLHEVEVNDLPASRDRSTVVVMHQTIQSPAAQKAALLVGNDDGHVVYLNGKQVAIRKGARDLKPLEQEYDLDLKKGNNDLYIKIVNHRGGSQLTFAYRSPAIPVPTKLIELISRAGEQRTDDQRLALQKYYRTVCCLHPDWLALVDQEKGIAKANEKLAGSIPTTLVWKELDKPRQAHVLTRGQYDQPADAVERATPSFLPAFPDNAPKDRLGLAAWSVSADHPLTSRVAVNRFWQQIFGTGLVKTSEDFGSQGQSPSHPKLLDWLAVDFRESGWDVKRLLKLMVTSETYRRSANVTKPMLQIDPTNRLFARGPRHRLDAEVLRDQALALSGMLVDKRGGASVKPPQPDGLWAAVGYSGSNTVRFKADEGEKVYRRSVYTFWKRTSPPPQMSTFDAPSRESCTARRERTNTPLQALLLMNETQYVKAANELAKRALQASEPSSVQQRAAWLFETVTCRLPDDGELNEMVTLVEDLTVHYTETPELAGKLCETSDANEAAWTMLASTLLNLDEVVSK